MNLRNDSDAARAAAEREAAASVESTPAPGKGKFDSTPRPAPPVRGEADKEVTSNLEVRANGDVHGTDVFNVGTGSGNGAKIRPRRPLGNRYGNDEFIVAGSGNGGDDRRIGNDYGGSHNGNVSFNN